MEHPEVDFFSLIKLVSWQVAYKQIEKAYSSWLWTIPKN